jgi:GntR family transcriptional regulator
MPPPRIQIDLDSTTPVNRQIVDQLRLQLVAGGIRPGDGLPSVRRLAIDLGVHFNTVADAYRTLAEEGWLDVSQGRAVRVRERAMPPASSETRQMFLRRLRQLIAEARASGVPAASLARDLAAIADTLK